MALKFSYCEDPITGKPIWRMETTEEGKTRTEKEIEKIINDIIPETSQEQKEATAKAIAEYINEEKTKWL